MPIDSRELTGHLAGNYNVAKIALLSTMNGMGQTEGQTLIP